MHAIIETGGKQYRVQKGDIVDIELLSDITDGTVEFKNVLFIGDGKKAHVGAPRLESAVVSADVVSEVKGPKVIAFKYKRRKSHHRKVGHRQKYNRVQIKEISLKGAK